MRLIKKQFGGVFIETTRATLSSHFQLTLRAYPLNYRQLDFAKILILLELG